MGKRDFTRFGFKTSFGWISYIAQSVPCWSKTLRVVYSRSAILAIKRGFGLNCHRTFPRLIWQFIKHISLSAVGANVPNVDCSIVYIYIYICVCVCVCVVEGEPLWFSDKNLPLQQLTWGEVCWPFHARFIYHIYPSGNLAKQEPSGFVFQRKIWL